MNKLTSAAILTLCGVLLSDLSFAAVTPQEAAALKTTLTPLGAEKAGNASGTIPAWSGGVAYKPDPSSVRVPNLFAGDKPVLSISAKNMAQYADKLSAGQKAMLTKYPDYRMDVYATQRTAAAPDWVYENTFKNATRSKIAEDGYKIEEAYGGTPFPLAKSGVEAMWNALLSWQGQANETRFNVWVTTNNGKRFLAGDNGLQFQQPYYFKNGPLKDYKQEYSLLRIRTDGPPQHAGEAALFRDPIDQIGVGRQAWAYLAGQRRTRKLPIASYDIPSPFNAGVINYDEVYLFYGPMDRYTWKLVGKKELYVPYNTNQFYQARKDDEALSERFMNPDHVRWELHRVWEVEATLAAGRRHVLPKRTFYLDEDTWIPLLADSVDGREQLKKTALFMPFAAPHVPAVVPLTFTTYDLQTGEWVTQTYNEKSSQIQFKEPWPDIYFTPDALTGAGVR